MKAGIYVRISSDVEATGLGVQRQEEDCRVLAAQRGWAVVEVFRDNDISAYSGKPRPGYDRLLEAAKSGRIDGIVAWHPDRLHRSPRELESFIDLVEATGCQVETVRAGAYDLTTPTGRMNARIVGAVARGESEHKSDRIRRKLLQNAQTGRHHGGSRPYGWRSDRTSLDDAEATVVRRAAEMILAGASVKSVARTFNAEGLTTSTGRPWRDVTVRDMLLRPRNAGLRLYHGEIIGPGAWEPILDEETWRAVERLLTDQRRRTTPATKGRRHLLSGIALCGVCGGPLRVAKGKAYKGKAKPIYRCQPRSCVTRDLVALEDFITALVVERLSRPDAIALLRDPDDSSAKDAMEQAERLRRQADQAAAAFADGGITIDQLRLINSRLMPQIEEFERLASANRPRPTALDGLARARDVADTWERLDLLQRRTVIAELLSIRVLPTRRGHGGFDPSAITIEWRCD